MLSRRNHQPPFLSRTLVLCLSLLLLGWVLPRQAVAQADESPRDYGIKSRRALKRYQEGGTALGYREWGRALSLFEEALEIEPAFWAAMHRAGMAAFEHEAYDKAKLYLRRAVDNDPDGFVLSYYYLGKIAVRELDFTEAERRLSQFVKTQEGQRSRVAAQLEEAQLLLPRLSFAAEQVKRPIPFAPENLGPAINSPGEDYFPSLTADGAMIFFTSRRAGALGGPNPFSGFGEDFYSATQTDTGWTTAQQLGDPINTEQNEGATVISQDGRFVYYTACNRRDGFGSCDIYMAEFDGDTWSNPTNLGPLVNSPFWDSYPTLSNDGNTLYFASERPGGQGGSDIYRSIKVNGAWQRAENLGAPINTPNDEDSPFIHADDRTLYFASNGHPGMGGKDLFLTELQANGEFLPPKNLGYPLNTLGDESTLFVSTDGMTGYYNSNREGGLGGIDIYRFEMAEQNRPKPATYVRGIVLNKTNNEPIGGATIQFVQLESQDTVREVQSLPTTGRFLLSLPLERDYGAFIEAPGFLFHSQNFSLKGIEGQPFYDLIIELQPPKAGLTTRLNNLFFSFDSASLKQESYVELQHLLRFMRQNPRVKIEVRGHTDNQGNPAYNQALSERRAKTVRNYLLNQGLQPERVTATGYGETQPLLPNDTEEGRAQNRRTEFQILQ